MHWLPWLLSGGVIQIWPTGINYNIQDNDLYLIVSTFITVTHIWWHCPTFITLILLCTNSFNEWPTFTLIYYLTYNWWHWPTFDDNDLHFMTLTYIWWHQSHWSGTLCRCPSKFYCPQTVTWYSSGVPLEPLRWQGVCTVACLWQTGPEHLHLQTQESWCSDWPTKRRRRELYKHDFFFSGGQSLQAIAFYSNQKPS